MRIFFSPIVLLVLGLSFSYVSHAEILFEGYYKVVQFKKHIGFYILRTELDAKSGFFKTYSFTRLAKNGFDMTESLQTVSDKDLAPVSYSYLAAEGKKTKTIEAKFNKDKMTAVATENGTALKIDKKIPKGTFLSTALYYLMLKSKDGLKTDSRYDFSAIAEELAEIKTGSAKIDKKMITKETLQLLKVKNTFSGIEYENLITDRGEAVTASTAATGIETELVRSSEEALEGIKVNSAVFEKLFGDIPAGKINVYHAKGK